MNEYERRFISVGEQTAQGLRSILCEHPEIRFVSIAGVDLMGHETDEKIPVSVFLKDLELFLQGTAVQTDGSSVILPGIATLNNAKIDMQVDGSVKWWLDVNEELVDEKTQRPVTTLKIPCTLIHDGLAVDSRSILKRAVTAFEQTLFELLKEHPEALALFDLGDDAIESVSLSAATELEFWVKTPEEHRDLSELSASQELKEQYWARTQGEVRCALEETLMIMEEYGLSPEMGHKEVGGVRSRLNQRGSLHGIMEQLEIDWKYDNPLQSADNELMVKLLVKETFRHHGMEVTFLAKPLEGVAGSGEHTHVGVMAKTQSGRTLNLFHGGSAQFLSRIGYGAVMGLLKNYEAVSPFVVQSNDAFRRLKKGYEAPICIVTSLGHSVEVPSRNRTILVGLIRDMENPMATRFELRSPNPHTNTYLALAAMLMTMLDGITYAVSSGVSEEDLLKELSKKPQEEGAYLEVGRMYRSEEDVFLAYTDAQREAYFGTVPETVWENVQGLKQHREKANVLCRGDVFTPNLIDSFAHAVTEKWRLEMEHRIIPRFVQEIRAMRRMHDGGNPLDESRWRCIDELRRSLMVDEPEHSCVVGQILNAFAEGAYEDASRLQLHLYEAMEDLRSAYRRYRNNLLQ
ncbi:Glutamine synthetase, clostridia type [Clostridiaceae bacterium JG1575]|nr:Glutamine synthetase, clostridia type [Clostridiaceae bacterium JG1575]